MARIFNARVGLTAEDDTLPDRMFTPLQGGPLKGKVIDRGQFSATRDVVYDMLGWDRQTAAPKRWKLYELGLDWVVQDMEKRGLARD
jgi:aldehyde:ferredoxin oxidoreductase